MDSIKVKQFGLAAGITTALLSVACAILIMTLGKEATITFSNSIFHGLDVTLIVRDKITFLQVLLGLFETFVIGLLIGLGLAFFYNLMSKSQHKTEHK